MARIKMDRGVTFTSLLSAKERAYGLKARGYKVKRVGKKVYSSINRVK